MLLRTPESLHYPITVTKLLRRPGDQVDRDAPLFNYTYESIVVEGSEEDKEGKPVKKTWPATFESYLEGTLTSWSIEEGKVIYKAKALIGEIEEPCRHEVQFGGMCADCGKDMTTVAYNTVTRDTQRATVNTVHGHTALLVSQAEASKTDEEAKRRLLSSRKLSLVVDLDQTIIHATVDPTVGEWQRDPSNINHESVKDVRAFQLLDDGPGARGCWYYIKLRPGLKEFLDTISKYYELHIYTMGTRAYAQNIAKIVDPERKIFADRILSRDESGSMTAKNLKRLFPVDTKMVVIIDDRGDVWNWSQNLIKVTPYDFFVGIGDINSSFLPKRPELESKPPKLTSEPDGVDTKDQAKDTSDAGYVNPATVATEKPALQLQTPPPTDGGVSAIDQLMSMGGGNDPNKLQQQTSEQDEAIAAQLADRPLLQKQKILDAAEEGNAETSANGDDGSPDIGEETLTEQHSKHRHNLLQDDDDELKYLGQSLQDVHSAFFSEYERNIGGSHGGRVAELRPGHAKKRTIDDLDVLPDVTGIMATMKQKVLKGVSIVFSGVVPLGVRIQSHDFAIWAKSFGATVTENITKRTTHVIASPQRRTAKVRQAAKKPDRIKIVTQHWLFDSLSQWQKLDEQPYRIHSEVSENGEKSNTANGSPFDEPDEFAALSSSGEEAAFTEDEGDTPNGLDKSSNVTHSAEQAELEKYMPTLSRADSSPHEETVEDWAAVNDEMKEFLGSDDDDDDESDIESVRTEGTESEAEESPSRNKRKRGDDEGASTDGEESDASLKGSRLERRKRKAMARTTSLTTSVGQGDGEDEDDATLEAELAAEMLRQDEEEDEE